MQRPCPPPDPNPHPPSFAVPPGATDCHAHVFGPAGRYPYQPNRAYTPPDLPLPQLRRMHRALGIERLVLVQASVHGADISAVLDAVASDPVNLRGVATMSEETTDRELTRMRDGGIRGIRVNLVDRGGMPFRSLAALAHAAERIRDHAMHIELLVHVESFPELRTLAKTICVSMSVSEFMPTGTSVKVPSSLAYLTAPSSMLLKNSLARDFITRPTTGFLSAARTA